VVCMETWETIRIRCRRDGDKIKVVARELGLSPNTVRKYLRQDGPPKYMATPRRKLLDRYVGHIDELIRSTPKITAVRVGSYLRQNVDADLRVDERTLREFVAARRRVLVPKEAFIRAAYAPGDQSQFDFSPMSVMLAGILVVVQIFVVRLSYSGRFMARASIRCDQPSLFEGLLAAFLAFGGLLLAGIEAPPACGNQNAPTLACLNRAPGAAIVRRLREERFDSRESIRYHPSLARPRDGAPRNRAPLGRRRKDRSPAAAPDRSRSHGTASFDSALEAGAVR